MVFGNCGSRSQAQVGGGRVCFYGQPSLPGSDGPSGIASLGISRAAQVGGDPNNGARDRGLSL